MFYRKRNPKITFEITEDGVKVQTLWGGKTPLDDFSTLINLINHGGFCDVICEKIKNRGTKMDDARVAFVLENIVDPNKKNKGPLVPADKVINNFVSEGLTNDGLD